MTGPVAPPMGRLGHEFESSEMSLTMKTRSMPPVFGILAFTAAFLCFIAGATLIYENEPMLGTVLLILAVTLVVLPIIWTIKNRR